MPATTKNNRYKMNKKMLKNYLTELLVENVNNVEVVQVIAKIIAKINTDKFSQIIEENEEMPLIYNCDKCDYKSAYLKVAKRHIAKCVKHPV